MPEQQRYERLPDNSPGVQAWVPPRVEDFGTLTELTAHLRVELSGQVARIAARAFAGSVPIPIPGGGGGGGGGGNNPVSQIAPAVGGGGTPGGSGGNLGALQTPTGTSPGSGGTLGAHAGGGGSGSGGGGGGGGKLPFTGFAVFVTAAVGASFVGAGAAVRSRLRWLRRHGD